MKTLKVVEFIRTHSNWEAELSSAPYNLTIKKDGGYILLAYNMIESDFSQPIVQECRGLILDLDFNPMCVPFFKFFNSAEGHAAKIDWSTARVQQKLDGSIIKLWHGSFGWIVSTNGTIFAKNASLGAAVLVAGYGEVKNYYDLFDLALFNIGISFDELTSNLDRTMTYMFELVSPYNRVVVPYSDTQLYHLGTRNNKTLNELEVKIPFISKPLSFPLQSVEDCIIATSQMGWDEEGFVVVDENWNRVKIKSPAYVAAHHVKNNGVVTIERIIDLVRANAHDDFVGIYPEYKETIENVVEAMNTLFNRIAEEAAVMPHSFDGRKDFAMWAKGTSCSAFFFQWYDNKVQRFQDFFWSQSNERIARMIGL